jgi:hypothetical protein
MKTTHTNILSNDGLLDALKRRETALHRRGANPMRGELVARNGCVGLWVGIGPGNVEWICWSCNDSDWRRMSAALTRAWEQAR